VKWPVGAEGDGYGNIAKLVRETPNSIGYVEFVFAVQNRLTYGKVQNAAGEFIGADSASMTGAAASAAIAVPSDFRSALTNSRGERSYPIPSCTWVLISQMASEPKRQAMKGFLRWALGDGQTYVEAAGFARLPSAIIEQELKAVEQIP
jgi:phosphate transport system substrate-binding protein